MIRRIVYISTATQAIDDFQLQALAKLADQRNKLVAVTGLLLYGGGHFIQVLEGPEQSIQATMNRINCDPRHTSVSVVINDSVPSRMFWKWNMGAANLESTGTVDPERLDSIIDGFRSKSGGAEKSRQAILLLLREFQALVGNTQREAG